jgi:beta-lactamase regulating signal transducer with metallopeptidase domain
MTESAVLQALVDAAVRATVIAMAVGLVLALLRARTGAAAHAAWTAVMLAMLALPIAPKWLPAIPVALPQATSLTATMDAPPPPVVPQVAQASARSRAQADVARTDSPAAPVVTGRVVSLPGPTDSSWPRAALIAWLFVAVVLLARVIAGWVMASRLARRSRPIAGRLYESPAVATPVAVGVWSPRIVVPRAWHAWAADMRAAVLTHELAHIRRRDTLVGLLAHVNCAIFWFNPLAWWLERRIAAAAEQACDDEVVRQSGERARYAELLVYMAHSTRRHGGRVAWQTAGIAGRRALGQRIDRVLDENGGVALGPARWCALILLSAAIIVPGIACQRQPPPLRENPELQAQFERDRVRNARYEAAKKLTLEEARELEAKVLENREDLELTNELLYFYLSSGTKVMGWNAMVAARRPHLLRLIERHPDSNYTRWPIPRRLDPDGWDQARAIWMKHISVPDVSSKILANAASFFAVSEKAVAEGLLLRAMQKDPNGPQPRIDANTYYSPWSSRLGELYARAIVGSDDDTLGNVVRSVSLDEASSPFAVAAKKKLGESKDPALLRAAGSYLTRNARVVDGRIGDQRIALGFDHRALGESYLDRAAALDPDSAATRQFETYRKRAAGEEGRYQLVSDRLRNWSTPTVAQVTALPEEDQFWLLPEMAAHAIMSAESIEHSVRDMTKFNAKLDRAREFGDAALAFAARHKGDPRAARTAYEAQLALGVVAIRRNDRARAVSHLNSAAALVTPETAIEEGVSMRSRLTNYLLSAGERDSVAQFFEKLASFPSPSQKTFAAAAQAIRNGQMPEAYQRQMTRR